MSQIIKKPKFKFVTEYLKHRKVTNTLEQPISHTALGDKKLDIYPGKYSVFPEEREYFLDIYSNWIFKYDEPEPLHLTEAHHPEKCPVLIDLDFRYKNKGSLERIYSESHIKIFIEIYFKVLEKYLDIPDENKETFIMEKSSPVIDTKNDKIIKDGVHIIMPRIVSNYKVLHMVRQDIIKDKEIAKLFKDLGITNPLNDIVDEAVIERNNWFMYGSKKPGKEPYLVTSIINFEEGEYQVYKGQKDYSNFDLVRILSINNDLEKNTCEIIIDEAELDKNYEDIFGKKKKKTLKKVNKRYMKKTNENLELIKQIVSILSPDRAENYDKWIRLGWCLHNIDYSLLDAWIEFSRQSVKFEDGCCEERWVEMKEEGGLEIGTLFRWAKIDNFEAYKKIMQEDIESLIKASLSKTHVDIAQVVYNLYKHEFKCVSIKNKMWYAFDNHRWYEMDGAGDLKKKISSDVVQEYCNYAGKCNEIIQQLDDATQRETFINRGKAAFEISSKLRDNNFIKHIIDCCAVLFHDKKFFERLDDNVDLIGFENGVYDLVNNEFREGYPDDYISFSTGIDYETFNENDDIVKDVRRFISQVLPEKEVREYILKVMGSFLSGKTGEEKFHIWTGVGGNGKSKLIELFEKSFGKYCGKMSVTLITQKRAASNACTPELVANKGKRFVTLQEPDDDERIHVGAMKELTGGDRIQGRALFKEPIEFKPQWKIVMTSNALPEITSNDRGTWRRIVVTEYVSKFMEPCEVKRILKEMESDNEDTSKAYLYPIDYDLSAKFDLWFEAFMWIIIKEYYKYQEDIKKFGSLQIPERCKENIRIYKEDCDKYQQFMNENIKKSIGDSLSIEEIYSVFQMWFRDAGYTGKIPNKKELEKNISNVYGRKKGKTWKGITIVETETMEEDKEN